jgi:hypothetical protein
MMAGETGEGVIEAGAQANDNSSNGSAAVFGGSLAETGAEGGEAAAAANGSTAPAASDFLAQFSPDAATEGDKSNREWITAKGFKDLDGLVAAHRNAERALHESGKVKIPGDGASDAELKAFNTAIGVPDDAKGYTVAPPKDGDGKDIPLNTEIIGALADAIHAGGIPMPAKAFEAAVQIYAKMQVDAAASLDREQMGKADAIAQGWGAARAENMAALDRAVGALELTRKEVAMMRNAMGAQRFIDRMLVLGHGISESKLFGGDIRTKFGMSEQEAQVEIDALKKTPGFAEKAAQPGTPEAAKWNRLQTILGEAANRKAAQQA